MTNGKNNGGRNGSDKVEDALNRQRKDLQRSTKTGMLARSKKIQLDHWPKKVEDRIVHDRGTKI